MIYEISFRRHTNGSNTGKQLKTLFQKNNFSKMDKKIEKQKFGRKQVMYVIAGVAILALSFFGFKSINEKTYKIKRDRISVKKAISDDFQDIILVEAVVEPISSVLVNAPEGGTVENIYVEGSVICRKKRRLWNR